MVHALHGPTQSLLTPVVGNNVCKDQEQKRTICNDSETNNNHTDTHDNKIHTSYADIVKGKFNKHKEDH